jgi:superfamily II DNA/RNA helicase
VDAYLHIAGRVGRFGRRGKVITVVEKDEGPGSETSKMSRILTTMGITAVQFEQFD